MGCCKRISGKAVVSLRWGGGGIGVGGCEDMARRGDGELSKTHFKGLCLELAEKPHTFSLIKTLKRTVSEV